MAFFWPKVAAGGRRGQSSFLLPVPMVEPGEIFGGRSEVNGICQVGLALHRGEKCTPFFLSFFPFFFLHFAEKCSFYRKLKKKKRLGGGPPLLAHKTKQPSVCSRKSHYFEAIFMDGPAGGECILGGVRSAVRNGEKMRPNWS